MPAIWLVKVATPGAGNNIQYGPYTQLGSARLHVINWLRSYQSVDQEGGKLTKSVMWYVAMISLRSGLFQSLTHGTWKNLSV
jgi:hypothetical protein